MDFAKPRLLNYACSISYNVPFGGKEHRFFKNAWENTNKVHPFIDLISNSLYVYSVLDTGPVTRKTGEQDRWSEQDRWTGEQDSLQEV